MKKWDYWMQDRSPLTRLLPKMAVEVHPGDQGVLWFMGIDGECYGYSIEISSVDFESHRIDFATKTPLDHRHEWGPGVQFGHGLHFEPGLSP